MKVLLVDPISPKGHIPFNKAFIETLLSIKASVCLLCSEDMSQVASVAKGKDIKIAFARTVNKGLWGRIVCLYNHLLAVNLKKKEGFNKVFFLSYDTLSLLVLGLFLNRDFVFISHNNISWAYSKNYLKRIFFKLSTRKHNVLFLTQDAMKKAVSLGVTNSYYFPHFLFKFDKKKDALSESHDDKKKIILWPGGSGSDKKFLSLLVNSKKLDSLLKRFNAVLVVKGASSFIGNSNIIMIKKYLTDVEFVKLFDQADILIMKYRSDYVGRASSLMSWIVSNQLNALIGNDFLIQDYLPFFSEDPTYDSFESLLEKLEFFLSQGGNFCVELDSFNQINSQYKLLHQKIINQLC